MVDVISPLDGDERQGYYVSIERQPGPQRGLLLGPFAGRQEAEARVGEGRKLAMQVDSRAAWDAFGVTHVVVAAGRQLPAGRLNHLAESASVTKIAH